LTVCLSPSGFECAPVERLRGSGIHRIDLAERRDLAAGDS